MTSYPAQDSHLISSTKERCATRPNIVFLLTDDQGPWAVPWQMPELQMPHLGRLAEEGIVFDNFYCTSPVCSPARASLLTGRMPSAHGIHDWLVGTRAPEAYPDTYLENMATLPAVLAGQGYVCALSGKWHVGDSHEPAPGFSYWYAHRFGGGPYYDAPIWCEGHEANEEEYFTDAVGNHAVEFLRSYASGTCRKIDADNSSHGGTSPSQIESKAPFYLQVCMTAPHDPWDEGNHPSELLDLYEGCDFPSVPRLPRHPWTQPRRADFEDAFADPVPSLRGYCAALSGVDRILGRIREELDQLGLADNTIIIYMADNGFSCGHHGVWGKGNGTFPLNMWENSVRVPYVLYVPPSLRVPGTTCEGLENGHVEDHLSAVTFFPTVCELTGVLPPVDPLRPGESVLPLVRGDKPAGSPVLVFDEYGGCRMIRDGDWKYVMRYKGPAELYNLAEDPEEEHNLAGDEGYAAREEELKKTLERWFACHETSEHRAFDQPVSGHGQIHPTWRRDEEQRYMPLADPDLAAASFDGVRRG